MSINLEIRPQQTCIYNSNSTKIMIQDMNKVPHCMHRCRPSSGIRIVFSDIKAGIQNLSQSDFYHVCIKVEYMYVNLQ